MLNLCGADWLCVLPKLNAVTALLRNMRWPKTSFWEFFLLVGIGRACLLIEIHISY